MKSPRPPKTDFDVPFDAEGNQLLMPIEGGDYTLRPNFEFRDTLIFKRIVRTKSGRFTTVFVRKGTGKEVYMSGKNLERCFKKRVFRGDRITGLFSFQRTGPSYGVRLIAAEMVT